MGTGFNINAIPAAVLRLSPLPLMRQLMLVETIRAAILSVNPGEIGGGT